MKLHVEIEVDDADLDAVAFALSLTPKEGKCRILQGQVNAQNEITRRMRMVGTDMIRDSHSMYNTHKELRRGA